MANKYRVGIMGCGDFLRWQKGPLAKSERVEVTALYDPDKARAEAYAAELGGRAVDDDKAILESDDIDLVLLFVPPWIRRGLVERAAGAGKHILTTKPLAPSIADAEAIVAATQDKVRCGVLYGRSGDAWVETAKQLFDDGRLGKLALYRQDWLHHYPQWNNWALDPSRNGGPFMDAMIHNLNAARYLMGRPVRKATFFSDRLAHPDLPCADTEAMKVDFAENGAAYLFITWAADLEVMSTAGNDREHIDLFYLVTDKGWHLTKDRHEGKPVIRASREGTIEHIPVQPLAGTTFDRFAAAIDADAPNPGDIVTPADALTDIRLVTQGPA